MPEYLFENAKGEQLSEYYDAAYAPRIGTQVELNGEIWTRMAAFGSVKGRRPVHVTSQQIEPWHPAAPRHDAHGQAQFNSRKEIQEFEAKTDYLYDEL